MKSFDQRWNQLTARARVGDPAIQSPSPAGSDVPHGFATRVVALARAQSASGSFSAEFLWLARTRRAFFIVAGIGMAMVALEFGTRRPHRLANPGIENTVAQVLWRL